MIFYKNVLHTKKISLFKDPGRAHMDPENLNNYVKINCLSGAMHPALSYSLHFVDLEKSVV